MIALLLVAVIVALTAVGVVVYLLARPPRNTVIAREHCTYRDTLETIRQQSLDEHLVTGSPFAQNIASQIRKVL